MHMDYELLFPTNCSIFWVIWVLLGCFGVRVTVENFLGFRHIDY